MIEWEQLQQETNFEYNELTSFVKNIIDDRNKHIEIFRNAFLALNSTTESELRWLIKNAIFEMTLQDLYTWKIKLSLKEECTVGGNDTHDKYGHPYEMDDSIDEFYNRLEDARDSIREFRTYLDKEIEVCLESRSAINIEYAQTKEILDNFIKIFSNVDY